MQNSTMQGSTVQDGTIKDRSIQGSTIKDQVMQGSTAEDGGVNRWLCEGGFWSSERMATLLRLRR